MKKSCDITQEDIELILLEFIESKLNERKSNHEKEILDIDNQRLKLHESYNKLLEFEERNLIELQEIYYIRSTFNFRDRYLSGVLNDISNEFRCLDIILESLSKFDLDFVQLTFSEIEDALGFSVATIKKYLQILCDKDKIIRKKFIGGNIFKVVK